MVTRPSPPEPECSLAEGHPSFCRWDRRMLGPGGGKGALAGLASRPGRGGQAGPPPTDSGPGQAHLLKWAVPPGAGHRPGPASWGWGAWPQGRKHGSSPARWPRSAAALTVGGAVRALQPPGPACGRRCLWSWGAWRRERVLSSPRQPRGGGQRCPRPALRACPVGGGRTSRSGAPGEAWPSVSTA